MSLKPNTTYIYERVGSEIYCREPGSTDRQLVGYDYHGVPTLTTTLKKMEEDKLWDEIRAAAKTNPALQSELDRVIMFYHLSLTQSTTIDHHPV